MSTAHLNIAQKLAAPFHPSEIKVLAKGGKQMPFVTARVVMNRLDEVIGFENWWDEYIPNENSVTCKLTFRLPDGTTITKTDVGAYAGMSDQGDDDKSGFSDAFKRAAVKFGVGRHLYNDGSPIYEQHVNGEVIEEAKPAPIKPPKSGLFTKEHVERTKDFVNWLSEQCRKINKKWHEDWDARFQKAQEDGQAVPDKVADVINTWQARGHLFKWAVESGRLDESVNTEEAKTRQADAYVAIVFHQHKKALVAEMGQYLDKQRQLKSDAIYRKNPDLAPAGWAEEQAEFEDKGDAYEGPDMDEQAARANGLTEAG